MVTIQAAAEQLLAESAGLRNAAVLKSPLQPWLVTETDVANLLRALPTCADRERITRVFVDGGERLDARRAVFARSPRPDESLAAWADSLFGKRPFGVVIYKAEQLDDALTTRLARFFEPVENALGIGLAGREVFVFLGNYGFTPMGAHKDREQGDVVHFHAGPSPKVMTIWTDREYEAAHGSREACPAPASLLAAGTSHRIEPGDIFVLPRGGYHVGYTPELSASVTVANVDATPDKVLDFALSSLAERLSSGEGVRVILGPERAALLSLAQVLSRPLPSDLGSLLEHAFADYQRSLLSNAGFSTPPQIHELESMAPIRSVRGKHPFRLQWVREDEQVVLHVRRRRLEFPWHEAWPSIVARLNEGCWVDAETLVAPLTDEWESDAAHYALATLVSLAGAEARDDP